MTCFYPSFSFVWVWCINSNLVSLLYTNADSCICLSSLLLPSAAVAISFFCYFVNLDIVFFFSVLLWHGSRFGMVSRIPAQNFFSSFYLTKSKIIPLRYPEQGKFLLSIELRHFLPWELKSNALWLSGMKKKKKKRKIKNGDFLANVSLIYDIISNIH